MSRVLFSILGFFFLLQPILGCGASKGGVTSTGIGMQKSPSERDSKKKESVSGPVDFLYTLEEESHLISEFRGKPLILVLIRTSEITSEIYLLEVVKAFEQAKGEARFLSLSIEPNEAPFAKMYADFHKLPFPLGIAEYSVANGKSGLGIIPIVPSTYIISASGNVSQVFAGVTTYEALLRSIRKAQK